MLQAATCANTNPFLYFSGVPVICRQCGTKLRKMSYQKGRQGSYLCPDCKAKEQ